MNAPATAADRGAARVPVRGLTVLYDANCPLCAHVSAWLRRQPQLVPLDLVPAASDEARRRYPGLDHTTTLNDVTVIGDQGQIYRATAAWVVVLWALTEYRPLSHRLSSPAGARLAKGAVLAAAKWRERTANRPPQRGWDTGWGGSVYRRQDGWTYYPDTGWLYERGRTNNASGASGGPRPPGPNLAKSPGGSGAQRPGPAEGSGTGFRPVEADADGGTCAGGACGTG